MKIINVVLFKEGEAKKNYREADLPLALVSVTTGRGFNIINNVIQVEAMSEEETVQFSPK